MSTPSAFRRDSSALMPAPSLVENPHLLGSTSSRGNPPLPPVPVRGRMNALRFHPGSHQTHGPFISPVRGRSWRTSGRRGAGPRSGIPTVCAAYIPLARPAARTRTSRYIPLRLSPRATLSSRLNCPSYWPTRRTPRGSTAPTCADAGSRPRRYVRYRKRIRPRVRSYGLSSTSTRSYGRILM